MLNLTKAVDKQIAYDVLEHTGKKDAKGQLMPYSGLDAVTFDVITEIRRRLMEHLSYTIKFTDGTTTTVTHTEYVNKHKGCAIVSDSWDDTLGIEFSNDETVVMSGFLHDRLMGSGVVYGFAKADSDAFKAKMDAAIVAIEAEVVAE